MYAIGQVFIIVNGKILNKLSSHLVALIANKQKKKKVSNCRHASKI